MPEPQKPSPEALARYAERFTDSQTLRLFGVRLSFPNGEYAQVDLEDVQPAHLGGLGSDAVNGGILAALFDLAVGCTPALLDPTRKSATIQLNLHFMRPVRGKKVRVIGRIKRAGGSTVFSTATAFDENGEACASCDGVIRMSREKWADGESPAIN